MAISAEHTEHVLYRLLNGNIEGIKPKVAMILIGTNNLGHEPHEKPEWAAAGVRKVVDTHSPRRGVWGRTLDPEACAGPPQRGTGDRHRS